jgi:hypothetical protein
MATDEQYFVAFGGILEGLFLGRPVQVISKSAMTSRYTELLPSFLKLLVVACLRVIDSRWQWSQPVKWLPEMICAYYMDIKIKQNNYCFLG